MVELFKLRLFKKRTDKEGMAPGSLVHVGRQKVENCTITVMDYDKSTLTETVLDDVEDCKQFLHDNSVSWINVDGLHEVEVIKKLGNMFKIHHLFLEDILNTGQRPRMDEGKDYLCVVMKMIYPSNEGNTDHFVIEQLSLILGPGYVISFQEKPEGIFEAVRQRIRDSKGRIRQAGSDYLFNVLIDATVDGYFSTLETLGERVETAEADAFTNPTVETLQMIHTLKREMIILRRSIRPLREIILNLQRLESPLIKKATMAYLHDVYDHVMQVIDMLESFRDVVNSLADLYLSTISNNMNNIMKILTVFAAIFIPLTFMAGWYGMNFKHMPELESEWGYPAFTAIVITVAVGMIFFFKRQKWI